MTALCPHCGFGLANDETFDADGLRFDPRGDVVWKGSPVHLDPSKRIIISSLLKERGRTVSNGVLGDRLGYDGDRVAALLSVHFCKLRKLLPGAPLETVRGVGVRWAA